MRSVDVDWQRGDYSSAEWADPEIACVVADGAGPGRWTGPAPMAAAWRKMLSAFTDARSQAEVYRELDAQRVLVLVQIGGAPALEAEEMSALPHRRVLSS
jgi:hypothetical protein